jgi:hypothetical protein
MLHISHLHSSIISPFVTRTTLLCTLPAAPSPHLAPSLALNLQGSRCLFRQHFSTAIQSVSLSSCLFRHSDVSAVRDTRPTSYRYYFQSTLAQTALAQPTRTNHDDPVPLPAVPSTCTAVIVHCPVTRLTQWLSPTPPSSPSSLECFFYYTSLPSSSSPSSASSQASPSSDYGVWD